MGVGEREERRDRLPVMWMGSGVAEIEVRVTLTLSGVVEATGREL